MAWHRSVASKCICCRHQKDDSPGSIRSGLQCARTKHLSTSICGQSLSSVDSSSTRLSFHFDWSKVPDVLRSSMCVASMARIPLAILKASSKAVNTLVGLASLASPTRSGGSAIAYSDEKAEKLKIASRCSAPPSVMCGRARRIADPECIDACE